MPTKKESEFGTKKSKIFERKERSPYGEPSFLFLSPKNNRQKFFSLYNDRSFKWNYHFYTRCKKIKCKGGNPRMEKLKKIIDYTKKNTRKGGTQQCKKQKQNLKERNNSSQI